jgi:factor associated with neutral sphingomyelinase activation
MQAAQHIAQQFSVLAVPTRRRGTSRFSLYLLEHGELFLYDFGGTLEGDDTTARGRLRCCSRSLVFEPADARAPLLKFPLRNVERLAHDQDGVAFGSSLYYELLANNIAAPFVKRTTFSERRFKPDHADPTELVKKIERIRDIAEQVSKEGPHVESDLLQPVTDSLKEARFDASMLEDFDEDVRGRFVCERVAPLTKLPGVLAVTSRRIYFQPAPLNDCGDGRVTLQLSDVVTVTPGRHLLTDTALEIDARRRSSRTLLRIAFASTDERDACSSVLLTCDALPKAIATPNWSLGDATRAWQRRDIDTFSYLAVLNQLSGRSVHDLSQYPVYPWVLADYASRTLNLDDPSSFRDLSKPVGALNPKRLATFRERFRHMAAPLPEPEAPPQPRDTSYETKLKAAREGFSGLIAQTAFGRKLVKQEAPPPPPPPPKVVPRAEDAPFLYGTHYSTPGYVLFFLVRTVPEFMLCLQNGRFDAPDRMFDGIEDAFSSVCEAPTDLKELIPEFYDGDGSFLKNDRNIPLGTTQSGRRLHDVTLPPWCASPQDFVKRHREALESDYVSQRIHLWIDLIFGRKQRSVDDDNVFHPLTYEGAVDLDGVGDQRRRAAFALQIDEFGQTPRKLFERSHPPRDGPLAVDPVVVKPPPVKKPSVKSIERAPKLATAPKVAKKPAPKPAPAPKPPPAPVRSPTAFLTKAPAPSLKLRPFPRASVDRRRPRLPTKPARLALKKTARPHRDAATDVSCAAGKVATAARDGTLRVSKLREDGALISVRQLVAASKRALTAAQVADDGACVICCGWDCAITVYDAATGVLVRRLDDAHDAAVSCGRLRGSVFCTGAWDATVKLWSVSDLCGTVDECGPFLELVDHEAPVTCVALASNASLVVAGADDGALLIWDARPAARLDRAPVGDAIISLAAPVVCVDIYSGAAGDRIIAAAEDGIIKEVALDGGELRRFDVSGEPRCLVAAEAARGALYIVVGRADGSLVLIAWDENEAPEERYVEEAAHGAAVAAVTVAGGGILISCADDCSAATWDFVSDDVVDGVAV